MTLSNNARQASYAQETDEIFVYLVTVDHPDLPGGMTLRFWASTQDDQEDLVSNGETYKAFPFLIAFPDRQGDQPPKSKVTLSAISDPNNADTDIVTIIRGLASPPIIGLTCVLASQPDVIEAQAPDMIVTQVDFDAVSIEGDLSYERILEEPFPSASYSPSLTPGVFA